MKTFIKLIFGLAIIFYVSSCGEVTKKVAIDDLVGSYKGTSKAVLQWSKLNIGIEDQVKDGDKPEIVKIKKNESGNLLVEFEDGPVMNLNNVQLAANGASFNIPQQKLNIPGMAGEVTGLNECTLGEARCDGFYDSQKNELSFSFGGTIKNAQNGEEYNVPMAMSYYKLSKEK